MGRVFKVRDRLNGQQVALKQVLLDAQRLIMSSGSKTFNPRLSLAREFQVLASLRHPHIISVLDYGFDVGQQPYFTMTLLDRPRDICRAADGWDVPGRVNLILAVLQALAYLHRRGIIHRDLKPDNVLVDSQNQVRLLDFGLALQAGNLYETGGTLAYMSPEVLLDKPPSRLSDLYSVGVLSYQVLTGQHPFDVTNISSLVRAMMDGDVDLSLLPAGIQPVIGRLLRPEPADRYQEAEEVIVELCRATGRELPPETKAIRESFLQAASFVGRDQELHQLLDGVQQVISGRGNGWLIGGESGVGKTRLLDELRTQAIIQGALTLRGQAVSEGGNPYRLWQEIVANLCLQTPLNDLEASVLKSIVPEIGDLLGREVADPSEVDADSNRRRLLNTLESLFQQQTNPIILLLEDLQWAGEGLELLKAVSQRLPHSPFMLVGTYRDDEAPNLPHQLPMMRVIKLKRFEEAAISALTVSMLGQELGQQPKVLDLLSRETEGNPFFIVEVVRALAEEAGQLANIGRITMPQALFVRGMVTILERRLQRVATDNLPLLKGAAVYGRQLDVNVLQVLSGRDNLDPWLLDCSNAAVLEVKHGVWQFSHDKLRETLLRQLPAAERQSLHSQVAQALEKAYPNESQNFHTLAYHWQQAGDSGKEAHYRLLAGRLAVSQGSHRPAIAHLERALHLAQERKATNLEKGQIARLLGDAQMGLGNMPQAKAVLFQALSWLGSPMPTGNLSLGLGLLGQFIRQLFYLRFPSRPEQNPTKRQRYEEILQAYRQLGFIFFLSNDSINYVYTTTTSLNAGEKTRLFPEKAVLYSSMAIVTRLLSLHTLSRIYRRKAEEYGNDWSIANVTLGLGITETADGNWAEAIRWAELGVRLSEQIGDYFALGAALNVAGTSVFNQGDYVKALEIFQRLYHLAIQVENRLYQGWGAVNQVTCLLRLGRDYDLALKLLVEAGNLVQETNDKVGELNVFATLALVHFRLGNQAEAIANLQLALPLMVSGATSVGSYEGFHDISLLAFTLWEGGHRPAEAWAKECCQRLKGFARTFAFARPLYHLALGYRSWLEGKVSQAQEQANQALQWAEQVAMPYEQGLAHTHLARYLAADDPGRDLHRQQALTIFKQLEANYTHQELVRLLLAP